MTRTRFLFFLIIFLFFTRANAGELTLEECISLAVKNHPVLKAYQMDVFSSEEGINISRAGFLPSLKFQGRETLRDKSDRLTFDANTFAPGIPPVQSEVSADNREFYDLSLKVGQPLFTGGQLTHSLKKSKILNEEARHHIERQKILLTVEVKRAFQEALKEQSRKKILEHITDSKKESLKTLKDRYREGYVQKEDVLVMETDLSVMESDLDKGESRRALALSRLKRIIYYQPDEELYLKGEPINYLLVASLPEVKEAAIKNRRDLKISQARLSAAGEDIEVAKSDFYPRASLQGQYFYQKETSSTRPQVWTLSLQVDWSLFEWGKTKSAVKKAEAFRQRRMYEHEDLMKTVALEAEEAWRAVKDQEKEVGIREKRLRTAEYRFTQATEKYAERVVKLADVIEVETELRKAYNEYRIGLNDLNIALAELEASTSEIQEGWVTLSIVYRPDFDFLSKRLEALAREDQKKPLETKEGKAALVEPKEVSQAAPPGLQPQAKPPPSSPAVEKKVMEGRPAETKTEAVTRSHPVAVRVGAYKERQNAEKHKALLLKKIGDKRIKIESRGTLYTVWITGFRDRGEAEAKMKELGITGFLIRRETVGK